MIIRGTTPYHNFILPILVEDIDEVLITYCQNEDIIFERTNKDISDDRFELINLVDMLENASMGELTEEEQQCSQLTLHLTQEETLKFKFYPAARKNIAIIQIRILTTDGEAYASELIKERIFGVRNDKVLQGVIPE